MSRTMQHSTSRPPSGLQRPGLAGAVRRAGAALPVRPRSRRTRSLLPLVIPAIALYALLTLYPLVKAIPLSMTDSTGGPSATGVGLSNYRSLFHDPAVTAALINTLVYTAVVVIVQNAIGLGLALMLRRWGRYGKTLAVVLLTPALLSGLMASYIWSTLYESDGPINAVLRALGLGSLQQVWLGNPSTALYAIAFVNIWMFAGFSAAIFAAGFRNIPEDMIEAARLDGASRWQAFWKIEWPMLAPALTVAVTLSLTGCMRAFELPLVMTNGGPGNASNTLALEVYNAVFNQFEVGYGTAVSVVLLILVVVIAAAVNAMLRRRERRI